MSLDAYYRREGCVAMSHFRQPRKFPGEYRGVCLVWVYIGTLVGTDCRSLDDTIGSQGQSTPGGLHEAARKGSNRAPRCACIRGARGDPERARRTYTPSPDPRRAQPVAPMPARSCTAQARHHAQRRPHGQTCEGKRSNRCIIPRDARRARLASLLLASGDGLPRTFLPDAHRKLVI